LSAGAHALGLGRTVETDGAEGVLAGVAYVAKIAVAHSQPTVASDGGDSSIAGGESSSVNVTTAQPNPATSMGGSSRGAVPAGSSEISDNNVGDSTAGTSGTLAPAATTTGPTPLSLPMAAPIPPLPAASSRPAAGSTSALAESGPEDESSAGASQDAHAPEEAALVGTGIGGAVYTSASADAGAGVSPAMNSAPNPPSALIGTSPSSPTSEATAAPVGILQPLATQGEAACGTGIALGELPSGDVQIAVPAGAHDSLIRTSSRAVHFQADRLHPALALDDPAASVEQKLEPRYADLVFDFLPFDRATIEVAVDRFLDQWENIAAEVTQFEPSSALLTGASVVAIATLTSVAINRRRRLHEDGQGSRTEDREEELTLLRSLPNSWNWGLAET
jgi:hypothetical protein